MQSSDTLVRMANQIAKFFAAQGEQRAVAGIADHLKKFWEPRMKQAIFAHLDAGGQGLEPLALKAVELLKQGSAGKAAPAAPQPSTAAAPKPAKSALPKGKARKANAH